MDSTITEELARQAKIKYALAEERIKERFLEAFKEAKGNLTEIWVSSKDATPELLDEVASKVSSEFNLANAGARYNGEDADGMNEGIIYRLVPKNKTDIVSAKKFDEQKSVFGFGIFAHSSSLLVTYATLAFDPWLLCFHVLFFACHAYLFYFDFVKAVREGKNRNMGGECSMGLILHLLFFTVTLAVLHTNWVTFTYIVFMFGFHFCM